MSGSSKAPKAGLSRLNRPPRTDGFMLFVSGFGICRLRRPSQIGRIYSGNRECVWGLMRKLGRILGEVAFDLFDLLMRLLLGLPPEDEEKKSPKQPLIDRASECIVPYKTSQYYP